MACSSAKGTGAAVGPRPRPAERRASSCSCSTGLLGMRKRSRQGRVGGGEERLDWRQSAWKALWPGASSHARGPGSEARQPAPGKVQATFHCEKGIWRTCLSPLGRTYCTINAHVLAGYLASTSYLQLCFSPPQLINCNKFFLCEQMQFSRQPLACLLPLYEMEL